MSNWPLSKWIYLLAGLALYLKMVLLPTLAPEVSGEAIVAAVTSDSGVPNAVSGIIFRNRLYDTIFEVVVFTIAIMGSKFLLATEQPSCSIDRLTDRPSIVLARLGATIAALVAIGLGIRGHLSPGGGFAAGVAGGTAIGLVAVSASPDWMQALDQRWQAATWEKISVLVFIFLAALMLMGYELPHGEMGNLISGGWLPILNFLVAVKVALGSWAAVLIFIRYRGLF